MALYHSGGRLPGEESVWRTGTSMDRTPGGLGHILHARVIGTDRRPALVPGITLRHEKNRGGQHDSSETSFFPFVLRSALPEAHSRPRIGDPTTPDCPRNAPDDRGSSGSLAQGLFAKVGVVGR